MTIALRTNNHTISIERAEQSASILFTAGREWIGIRAGTTIRIDGRAHAFEADTSLAVAGTILPGYDYGVGINQAGRPFVEIATAKNPIDAGYFGGFHFSPGGNAEGMIGGDDVPTINPHSVWDLGFRPTCPDPRGMALINMPGDRCFWADIYLLGVDHVHGTSRQGAVIADGRDLPQRADGGGTKHQKLDYATAVEIYAHHGKRLLGAEEFFAAAYGVKERCARGAEPTISGSLSDDAKRFISQHGLFDATGTMWQWGMDGHPDDPRPSVFGGSWFYGADAGSRYARLDYWPEISDELIGARGASDHLIPA